MTKKSTKEHSKWEITNRNLRAMKKVIAKLNKRIKKLEKKK